MLANFCGAHSQHEVPGTCDRRSAWHMRSPLCLSNIASVQYRLAEVVAARAGWGVESLRSYCVFFLNARSPLAILLLGALRAGRLGLSLENGFSIILEVPVGFVYGFIHPFCDETHMLEQYEVPD